MKKLLRFLGLGLVLIFGILFLAPFLFQDKIKELVETEINRTVNAEVYFGEVGLSFIKNFPNAQIGIEDFGIVGEEAFDNDTLLQVKGFNLVVDLFSVLGGNEIQLKKLVLNNPRIHAIVLENGLANWDIMATDTTTTRTTDEPTTTSESGNLKLNLNAYEINDAYITYEDATLPATLYIEDLDHSGNGAFTEIKYDLSTRTKATSISASYDGISYANAIALLADIDMNIDTEGDITVVLKDNNIKINDFPLTVDGKLEVKEEDIDMDLDIKTGSNVTFKSLLSLVPAIYRQEFDGLVAEGTFSFDANAKGTYNEQQLPAFMVNLVVEDGMMKYPDLPDQIKQIQLDLHVTNPDGDLENTTINLNQFHANMGKNPIDAKAVIKGLSRVEIDGEITAILDLEEITKVVPVEGNTLRGTFSIDANANGVYDTLTNSFPRVEAKMSMKDGYVKNGEYPAEVEQLVFDASLVDPDGKMEDAVFDMPNFSFALDGEPIKGSAHVENLLDPMYEVAVDGTLDFEKLLNLYPIEGMVLRGRMMLDEVKTKGRLSDVENERYERLESSGGVTIQSLYYSDADLPQGVTIETASANFTPEQLVFTDLKGKSGESDFTTNGYVKNYIGYALIEGETLKGAASLASNRFNLNEFMIEQTPSSSNSETSERTVEGTTEISEEMAVIPIPENVDLVFQASINEVLYGNLVLNNMEGVIEVVDQKVLMDNVKFNVLGGEVNMSGNYNTTNIVKPTYGFKLDVSQIGFKEAYTNFNTVQAFAPVSQFITGKVNTKLSLTGSLDQQLNPVLTNITGEGLFEALNGSISDFPILTFLADKTKIDALNNLSFDDIEGKFSILDGFINIAPFDLSFQDIVMTVSGRQNISGLMDFNIDLDLPSGTLGNAALGALTNLTGGAIQPNERIQLTLTLGGTSTDPKLTGLQSNTVADLQSQAVDLVENKISEKLGTNVELSTDSLKARTQATQEQIKDSVKVLANDAKEQLQDSLESAADKVTEKLKDELEDQIGEEAKKQLDDLKEKFKFPKKKNKDN